MSLRKKRRWRRDGFTLMELLMAMLIAVIVMGSAVMLLRHGVLLTTSNVAYTAAQRGALSSLELLSKEIAAAGEVEIISDEKHKSKIDEGLEEGWNYVVLNQSEVHYIHTKEDGTSVDEKVPGSEYIEDISFSTDVFPDSQKGGRLLRVFVKAAYGSAGDVKTVNLDRTILVRAAEGVLGEGGATPAASGRILRYRLWAPVPPELDVYGSINKEGEEVAFDYETSDKWKDLKTFEDFTELDARLTLTLQTKEEAENLVSANGPVLFTWIAADETMFNEDIVKSANAKNSEAILEYLEEHGFAEPWPETVDRYVLGSPDPDGEIELPEELIKNPYEKGFRLLAVTSGKLKSEETDIGKRRVCFEVDTETTPYGGKFSLGMVADSYKGGYMIVVASFPGGDGSVTKLPVYVKLGSSVQSQEGDSVWDAITAELDDDTTTTANGRTFQNTDPDKYGEMTVYKDPDTERRYFKVSVSTDSLLPPVVMLKLASNDFAHMIPEDAVADKDKTKIFYGPTNYAVYIDVKIDPFKEIASGGFAVLLNGSSVDITQTDPPEYRSGGYYFQADAGANGFVFPYYGYKNDTNAYEWSIRMFGVRMMYFYDAAKEKFPAPGSISFFNTSETNNTSRTTENFNDNAGAEPPVNYRLPLSARSPYYTDIRSSDFSADMEGRDDRPLRHGANAYGMMFGMNQPSYSAYTPKRMQSWHKYSDTTIEDMLTEEGNDDRIGFRWDRSWNIHAQAFDGYTSLGDTDTNRQRTLWEQRQILKVTVLEVTRDITANEVDNDAWRDAIHHGGELSVPTNNLTRLGNDHVIHASGDMFVRAELIQLKKGVTDWHNSRYYVYSKPIWFGKFKGDAWRGDYLSPFKKLGNTMQHIVADPEPPRGDAQSFRRRGMRVRSWKEAFLGWDFTKVVQDSGRFRYVWRDFVNEVSKAYNKNDPFGISDTESKKMPPDFFKTVYNSTWGIDASQTGNAHSVWTPPIAVNLGAYNTVRNASNVVQSGDATDKTFGQYMSANQYVRREGRGQYYAYNGRYGVNGTTEGSRIYGRLSYLRPWRTRETQGNNSYMPNHTTPIFGLYAMRGWDFGTSGNNSPVLVYDRRDGTDNPYTYPNSSKRFLTVVQGLRLPYKPNVNYSREPNGVNTYKADRDRIIGFRFWGSGTDNGEPTTVNLYDTWIGEGFSPREVRAILGLTTTISADIRNTYVGSALEAQDFYVLPGGTN